MSSANILVLIPTRLSNIHPQSPRHYVQAHFYGLNSATSPGDPNVIWDANNPMYNITAGRYIWQSIQVWDQFGISLNSVYTHAEVDEIFITGQFNINSPMQGDGTYLDPVGTGSAIGKIVHSGIAVRSWYETPVTAAYDLMDATVIFANIGIVVDGNTLQSGVINRTLKTFAPSDLEIVWPPTL